MFCSSCLSEHDAFFCDVQGGIHEFADSQFGHIFAKGPNREAARHSKGGCCENLLAHSPFEV